MSSSVMVSLVLTLLLLICGHAAGMSGSGDGSDDVEGCVVYNRPEMPSVRERDARTEIRCHLACIEMVSHA